MSNQQEKLWDRTLRRIQDIWPLSDSAELKKKVSPHLPKSDLPKLRKKIDKCLMGKGGEVSARKRAAELGETYSVLNEHGRRKFLELLATEYDVDNTRVEEAIILREEASDNIDRHQATMALRDLLEPPRAKLLRQFNELEEGVKFLVDLRVELMKWAKEDERLKALDLDVYRLLSSWFDVGFLNLQQITWKTPAAVLEKLIEYEAVHKIRSWKDLKHRLEEDRCCYAFFHPRMPDEPLIFVEVALVNGIARNIHELLDEKAPTGDPHKADTAIFYSISNCQKGLAGVSFGNFLIKRVVADLANKMPNLKQFCTLSPIPGFMKWVKKHANSHELGKYGSSAIDVIFEEDLSKGVLRKILKDEAVVADKTTHKDLKPTIKSICAHYLINAKRGDLAYDRVANFHLTNGARIHQINWAADTSDKGIKQSAGLMVNYIYDIPSIEKNHETYITLGEIPVSAKVKKLVK